MIPQIFYSTSLFLSTTYAQFTTYFKVLSSLNIKQFLLYHNLDDLFYVLYSQTSGGVELFELIINKTVIEARGSSLSEISNTANSLMQELILLSNLESRTLQTVVEDNQIYIDNTFNSLFI